MRLGNNGQGFFAKILSIPHKLSLENRAGSSAQGALLGAEVRQDHRTITQDMLEERTDIIP